MNIALVLQHKLLLGIQRLLQGSTQQALAQPAYGLRPVQAGVTHARGQASLPGHASPRAPRPAAARSSVAASATRHLAQKAMPLRVLRVVESGMPRSSAGRLLISGRMADVCAELDRLVEREAALQTLH